MRIHFDTHEFLYAIKFLALAGSVFVLGNFSAKNLEEYLSPEAFFAEQQTSKDGNEVYLDPPGEKPVFLDPKSVMKKKDSFIWEKRDFIYINAAEKTLKLFTAGVETKTYPLASVGKDGTFFDVPGGMYRVQKKLANHSSRIEKANFPWTLNLFGNYLIHGTPLNSGRTPLKNFEGGGFTLALDQAHELYGSVPEGTSILVEAKPQTSRIEFSYFKKTNLPHSVPEVTAASALAIDLDTSHILFEKNKTDPFPTASITKLMTALVAQETIASSSTIAITKEAYDTYGYSGGFSIGEEFSFEDLLYGMILPSSNDAARAFELARTDFLAALNEKAKGLAMNQTFFEDSSGLSQENVASAADLATFLKHLYATDPELLKISAAKEYTAFSKNKKIRHVWRNINWPQNDKRFLGGKAGWTEDSLQTMAGIYNVCVSEFCGRPVAIIILGSRDRIRDVRAVISYLEKEFIYGSIISENKTARKVPAGAAILETIESREPILK